MQKILLLSLAGALAVCASAAPVPATPKVLLSNSTAIAPVTVKAKPTAQKSQKLATNLYLDTYTDGSSTVKKLRNLNGVKNLVAAKAPIAAARKALNKISPVGPQRAAALPSGAVLWESFEGWDGQTKPWAPENWIVESHSGRATDSGECWNPSGEAMFIGAPTDGQYMMLVSCCMGAPMDEHEDPFQDEWIISPEFTVEENDILTFDAFISPVFLFDLTDPSFDFNTFEFTGDPVYATTLKALVKEEGATDWVEIWDVSTPYRDMSVNEALNEPDGFYSFSVKLNDYYGKKVQIAFQYVGKNGNTMCLDAVKVGLPALKITYDEPAETLFWGQTADAQWAQMSADFAMYPVLAPITWTNNNEIEGVDNITYYWDYCEPVNSSWDIAFTKDLTVTYVPDYTSESSTRNNLFYTPKLNAFAEGASDGLYQAPYPYFQAGGKSERIIQDKLYEFGLLPFNSTHLLSALTAPVPDDDPTPVFGYDANHNSYWVNYTNNGEEPQEGDDVYVSSLINLIYPGTSPLVINGAHVIGTGFINDGVQFKAEIIKLSEEGTIIDDNILATATCDYDHVNTFVQESGDGLNIVFKFDKPVVIPANTADVQDFYLIRFSGFHDPDNVDRFSPYQSIIPFTHDRLYGWVEKQIKIAGAADYVSSLSPMLYQETQYGPCHGAFAINLDAEYPWLAAEPSEIEVPATGEIHVALDSYYPADKLTVEAPEGIVANLTGCYNTTDLAVSAVEGANIEGSLTVKGPGVEKSFTLTKSASISTIGADKAAAEATDAYDLTGRRVSLKQASSAPGTYILRRADGSASKVLVK